MNPIDLERAKIKQADAVLILANKESLSPDSEDEANIMRLLQYHNKMYLLNIPSWDWKQGDEAVCIAELKLGLMAQSCLAPGFSSLMANLFAMRSYKEVFNDGATSLYKKAYKDPWLPHYLRGSSMEMYTEYLSPAFTGKTFTEAAIICFTKLKLLLLAIESSNESGIGSHLSINPGNSVRVEAGTRGFFIAGSFEEIKRAFFYCEYCHKHVIDLNKIKQCKCNQVKSLLGKTVSRMTKKSLSADQELVVEIPKEEITICEQEPHLKIDFVNTDEKFDSTGMFHWTEEQKFNDCLLDNSTKHSSFIGHVIVCVFAEPNSPLIGLRSFVLPLRASNLHYAELKKIVFIGNKEFLFKEWKALCNFPKVYILPGSPNSRSLLRSVNIQFCDMAVVLSSIDRDAQDENLVDKSAILCSLNIKAMNFDDSTGLIGQMDQILSPTLASYLNPAQNWKTTIGLNIPMLTELRVDSNVQFLDQDDEDDPNKELYMSQPFACGTAFAISVLDCIMSTAYFNDNALTLIRTLITGGTTPELEQILAEGANIAPGDIRDTFQNRNRPRVSQISLFDGEFAKYGENRLYGELFVYCLTKHNMICWGVYRFRDAEMGLQKIPTPSNKRYVICNPSADFKLIQTDLVYVLEQFNPNKMVKRQSLTRNEIQHMPEVKNQVKRASSKASVHTEIGLRKAYSKSPSHSRQRKSKRNSLKKSATDREVNVDPGAFLLKDKRAVDHGQTDFLLRKEINESTF
ncbi:Calcium-activated potassium channel subunit alpha [Brachionus plicatilis]|uniref:Calcium-activated potassium channel subunit alpha n=1 Tax=Brachionus plicatilis TaxID=10195 RepID=A0A3M7T440_BRAPC|nr:Calcium-activated potassium channel subunit alpha [Brachionus plicatilis]